MCARKGIDVVATGDWTHPGWFEHLKEHLVESDPGMYRLGGREAFGREVRFMLVTEVSQIYKKGEKTRRIHNLVFSPSLETCARVNAELDRRGFNRRADGRPIFGMDSEDFYRRLKEIDERLILIPAHAWTPWYSVFGSKSGFDSLEECFGEMTGHVHAIETGLSSDPKMNWRVSALDSVAMISNSDAHSPDKLGREANVFDLAAPSYDEFVRALRERDATKFLRTIEFFPEEGKYHLDGCAGCSFSSVPARTKKIGGRCPTCGKPLTLGVEHRVEQLADRDAASVADRKIPYASIVPLKEIIADALGVGVASKRVAAAYARLTDRVANEFALLMDVPIEAIAAEGGDAAIAEAVRRVREGRVRLVAGYDGVFGTVRAFADDDRPARPRQACLV
jgi:uncharacterized protein (TIGR00375 family)